MTSKLEVARFLGCTSPGVEAHVEGGRTHSSTTATRATLPQEGRKRARKTVAESWQRTRRGGSSEFSQVVNLERYVELDDKYGSG